jgi:hypothetical protein
MACPLAIALQRVICREVHLSAETCFPRLAARPIIMEGSTVGFSATVILKRSLVYWTDYLIRLQWPKSLQTAMIEINELVVTLQARVLLFVTIRLGVLIMVGSIPRGLSFGLLE